LNEEHRTEELKKINIKPEDKTYTWKPEEENSTKY
jgi:hypothetical protein